MSDFGPGGPDATGPGPGWLPVHIEAGGPGRVQPTVTWLRCEVLDCRPAKFGLSVDALRAQGAPQVETGLAGLHRVAAESSALPLHGWVFHMARCGSTLVSNALSALPGALVIKEAQPLDALLRRELPIDDAERQALLMSLLGCLGQPFRGDERLVWIKPTSWNVLHHARLCAVTPTVPRLFVYRDPLECLVSMLRAAPAWPFDPVEGVQRGELEPTEYYARVLGAYLEAGLELVEAGGLAVNYRDLAHDLVPRCLTPLGAAITPEVQAFIEEHRRVHAKQPGLAFTPDSTEKRRSATDEAREAVDRWARAAYDALELRR